MKEVVVTRSPINIALCKYWGKKDEIHVLPYTDSISISLDSYYSETRIEKKVDGEFEFFLNGVKEEGFNKERVCTFARLIQPDIDRLPIRITSNNTGPTAAGLASSASGFSALALALATFFEKAYTFEELITITRKGSGSACRSFLDGFVLWKRDGQIEKLVDAPKDLVVMVVLVNNSSKQISSREAMKLGVKTSPYYGEYVKKNQSIARKMRKSLDPFHFEEVGRLMEESTALMHKVMKTSEPEVLYPNKDSYKVMDIVKELRKKSIKAYTTMDAGPNVKIFTNEENKDSVIDALKKEGYTSIDVLKPGEKAKVIYSE